MATCWDSFSSGAKIKTATNIIFSPSSGLDFRTFIIHVILSLSVAFRLIPKFRDTITLSLIFNYQNIYHFFLTLVW